MQIIRKNAWIGLALALISFANFSAAAATSTNSPAASDQAAETKHRVGSLEWFAKTLPYPATVVESAEATEMSNITTQARTLFQARDFEKLDTFVQKLRDSKEQFASGTWKFYFAYCSISLAEEASEEEWKAHFAALHDWTNARPQSITARVALASALASYAWKARGSGWANEVAEQGWQLFGERLNEASKVLVGARSLKEQCPYAWSILFQTELGLSTSRRVFDANFQRAITEWPGYMPFYQRRAWYLLPRWNGREGEWEADLAKSADKIGGEEGDMLYARVVWSMHQSQLFSNIFNENAISWPRVNKGMEAIEKRFPDSLQAKSEHAYLAAIARDAATTRKYFSQIQGQVDLSIWRSREKFLQCADWSSVQEDQARAAQ